MQSVPQTSLDMVYDSTTASIGFDLSSMPLFQSTIQNCNITFGLSLNDGFSNKSSLGFVKLRENRYLEADMEMLNQQDEAAVFYLVSSISSSNFITRKVQFTKSTSPSVFCKS